MKDESFRKIGAAKGRQDEDGAAVNGPEESGGEKWLKGKENQVW